MDKKSTFILAINRRAGGAYYIQQQQQHWYKSRSEWQTNGTVNNGTVNNGTVNKYCINSITGKNVTPFAITLKILYVVQQYLSVASGTTVLQDKRPESIPIPLSPEPRYHHHHHQPTNFVRLSSKICFLPRWVLERNT